MDSFINGNDFYSCLTLTIQWRLFFVLNFILVVGRTKSHILGIVCPPVRINSFELIKYGCFMWIVSFLICCKQSFLIHLFLLLIFFTRSCKMWLLICQNRSWNYLTTRHTKNSYCIWSVEELCKVLKTIHNLDWCREKDYGKIITLMLVEKRQEKWKWYHDISTVYGSWVIIRWYSLVLCLSICSA